MLNTGAAISYNQAAGFPGYIVRGILSAVGASEGETWTAAGVTAVDSVSV